MVNEKVTVFADGVVVVVVVDVVVVVVVVVVGVVVVDEGKVVGNSFVVNAVVGFNVEVEIFKKTHCL